MSVYGIKDNKCFEAVSSKPTMNVVITQPTDITTDSSTGLAWTILPESSQATGDRTILIPDVFFPQCAVTVTPVINSENDNNSTWYTIAGAIRITPFIINAPDTNDQIVIYIDHSEINSVTIPAGTQYVVTFIQL